MLKWVVDYAAPMADTRSKRLRWKSDCERNELATKL
jgi:hypothetical protein